MKKIYLKASAVIAALGLVATPLNAQLSGLYTINSGVGTGGTNFQTFTDLATALTASGVTGPVTVNVVANSGPYNEQPNFTNINGTSATNKIIINGNGNLLTYSSTNSNQPWTLGVGGADRLSVNNLNVWAGGSSYAHAVHLFNGADNNTFTNCTFSTQPNTFGGSYQLPIVISGGAPWYYSSGSGGNNNTFEGCQTSGGYFGVIFYCPNSTRNYGNKLINTVVEDYYYYGVYTQYQDFLTITGNTIQRLNRTTSNSCYGITIWYTSGSVIDGNKVHKLFEQQPTGFNSLYGGILVYDYANPAPAGYSKSFVRNNIIADMKGNGTHYGLYLYYTWADVLHNTISFDDQNSTSGTTYGLYFVTQSGMGQTNFKHNLISITRGGTSTRYGAYVQSPMLFAADNNNYHITGSNAYIGYYSGQHTALSTWQTAGMDATTGYTINPQYVNINNDLHPTNAAFNNLGTSTGVLFDQQNAIRHQTTPDIGALEFLTPMCAGTGSQTVAGPTYSLCPGESTTFLIGNLSSDLGYTYQWQMSNTSAVGPFTLIPGANSILHNSAPINTTMWYSAIITCTAAGGSSIAPVAQVNVSGVTTSQVPYLEDFEGIGMANRLPNCSWTAPSLGSGARTYTSSSAGNLLPRSGTSFAAFNNGTPGTNYFYTNGIYLNPGITYSASLWFQTDLTGASNWSNLAILLGTSQTSSGLTQIASTNGAAISPFYKSLSNTFTVAAPGLYYVAVRATGASGAAVNLSWDDLAIEIPCSLNSPAVSLSANNTTVCAGKPVVLTASGGDTFSWSTGDNTSNITVYPNINTLYSVTGTSTLTGCGTTMSQLITVHPSPVVIAVASKQAVCAGEKVTLTAGGALSYAWSTGGNGSNISVSPTGLTTYSVIGTNQYNCNTTAMVTVSVNPNPNVQINVSNNLVCAGDAITLTGTGASTYNWLTSSNFNLMGNPVTSTPLTTGAYTVTGTDANGCSGTAVMSIAVEPCVGISENVKQSLRVYPNPTSGLFTVEMGSNLNKAIEVTDVTGRVILSGSTATESFNVDLSGLAAGVYYVKVSSAEGADVIKVIRN